MAAVVLAHVWLLAGLPLGSAMGRRPAEPLSLRTVVLTPPPAALESAVEAPAAAPVSPPAAATEPVSAAAPPPAAAEPVPPPAAPPAAPRVEVAANDPAPPPTEPAEPEAEPGSAVPVAMVTATGSAEVPVYPTRLPPPATLHYELRRGLVSGRGVLHWLPGPESYQLTIEGHAFGMPILSWWSRGGYDSAGLAPQRFVDRRRARALRAANFQRDSGRITYSGTPIEQPLLPGAQDRLSWLVQLAGIAEADPRRLVSGAQVSMQVTGARGDAEIWTFDVLERAVVELAGGGSAEALHLRRQPRREFDTRADVWLDPARHHLPVRLRLAAPRDAEALEFLLRTRPPDGTGG